MKQRHLQWDGCCNVRDLGGLPTTTGATTRFGRVVRADNLRQLTAPGWHAALAHGIRTVVDLRFDEERRGDQPVPEPIDVVPLSLFGSLDAPHNEEIDAIVRHADDPASANAGMYAVALDSVRDPIARACAAVADAPAGGVAIHCWVGKDRTGIVTAFLLLVAGVTESAIADDYALTEGRVGPVVDSWVAKASDPRERRFRDHMSRAPRAAMETMLTVVRTEHGGAEAYLRASGLGDSEISRMRSRLLAA